jgi:predicted membrane-bound spermidine synthase
MLAKGKGQRAKVQAGMPAPPAPCSMPYALCPMLFCTRIIILTLFFFSGASGLIYEVVWNRMLMLVFGATAYAVATVLTAFMAGMAQGSFYFGRFIDRRTPALAFFIRSLA